MYIIDLEMNQPSGTVIQIGSVHLNMNTGEITRRLSIITNPGELPCSRISALTGISPEQVSEGMLLIPAIQKLWEDAGTKVRLGAWGKDWKWVTQNVVHYALHDPKRHNPLPHPDIILGKSLDMQSFYRTLMILRGDKKKPGLKVTAKNLGVEWEGSEHDAQDDAYMTAKVWWAIAQSLR